jgi:hypothetical protein
MKENRNDINRALKPLGVSRVSRAIPASSTEDLKPKPSKTALFVW